MTDDIKIGGTGSKSFQQWSTLPFKVFVGLKNEPEKWRSIAVPIKFMDAQTNKLHEYIIYCVVPNKEFQDLFNEIQRQFPEEEKLAKAQEMFKDVLAGIKTMLENLKEEWKIIYKGEKLEDWK